MNIPLTESNPLSIELEMARFSRSEQLRWILTHLIVKNGLNPLSLCALSVSILYSLSSTTSETWLRSGSLYLSLALGVPIALSILGVRQGWLLDPLAPRVEVRPFLYSVNAVTCAVVLLVLHRILAPIELRQVCLIHLLGMVFLGLQTSITCRRTCSPSFKASMHVFAATAVSLLVIHHYLLKESTSAVSASLSVGSGAALVLFVAWGRVYHVPTPEHTWTEVILGALAALLALTCALQFLS